MPPSIAAVFGYAHYLFSKFQKYRRFDKAGEFFCSTEVHNVSPERVSYTLQSCDPGPVLQPNSHLDLSDQVFLDSVSSASP